MGVHKDELLVQFGMENFDDHLSAGVDEVSVGVNIFLRFLQIQFGRHFLLLLEGQWKELQQTAFFVVDDDVYGSCDVGVIAIERKAWASEQPVSFQFSQVEVFQVFPKIRKRFFAAHF